VVGSKPVGQSDRPLCTHLFSARGAVRVSINNGCGASGYSGITVYPIDCGTSTFAIYPNPADEALNVELVSENDTTSTGSSPELNMAINDTSLGVE